MQRQRRRSRHCERDHRERQGIAAFGASTDYVVLFTVNEIVWVRLIY
jgi:uncharacterized membrane protein